MQLRQCNKHIGSEGYIMNSNTIKHKSTRYKRSDSDRAAGGTRQTQYPFTSASEYNPANSIVSLHERLKLQDNDNMKNTSAYGNYTIIVLVSKIVREYVHQI